MNNRRPTRLQSYDYNLPGSYFITICVMDHKCSFGYVNNGEMIHNQLGIIALEQFSWLSSHYNYVDVSICTVMPNHVHAIININPGDAIRAPLSLSQLVGAYKTKVSFNIHKLGKKNFAWQRSFHDHIIRTRPSYNRIALYIKNNPINWEKDRFHV